MSLFAVSKMVGISRPSTARMPHARGDAAVGNGDDEAPHAPRAPGPAVGPLATTPPGALPLPSPSRPIRAQTGEAASASVITADLAEGAPMWTPDAPTEPAQPQASAPPGDPTSVVIMPEAAEAAH